MQVIVTFLFQVEFCRFILKFAGITQFHLPEANEAQILDGIITLSYSNKIVWNNVISKVDNPSKVLRNSKFQKLKRENGISITRKM